MCDVDGYGSTELAVIIPRARHPAGSIGKGFPGVAVYNSKTLTECPRAKFDQNGALANADEAIGEIVNTSGGGLFTGYHNDDKATAERLHDGMYWSGDLAYVDDDGWFYLAGRTGDWMRVDGENMPPVRSNECCCGCRRSIASLSTRFPMSTSATR